MSSTDSPLIRDPDDLVLDKLCKKAATFTKAKQYYDELQHFSVSGGPGELPDGVLSLCAFIASEQLENKDVSVGTARTSSDLQWEQFWRSLTQVQDLLEQAAQASKNAFQYARLPIYTPSCDTCESKNYECIRKTAPSTKCQVCSIRKKICTRQGSPGAQRKQSEDSGRVLEGEFWYSGSDSETEVGKEERNLQKSVSLMKEILHPKSDGECLEKGHTSPIPRKSLSSPTASPKWTTLEDQSNDVLKSHPGAWAKPPLSKDKQYNSSGLAKRRPSPSSAVDGQGKKRRIDDERQASSSKTPLLERPLIELVYRPPESVVNAPQRSNLNSTAPKSSSNGNTSASRRYPRPPSPMSSDSGPSSRPKAPSNSHGRPPNSPPLEGSKYRSDSESRILIDSLHKKAREIISYVEAKGCKGIALRLQILDMKTRVVELDKAQRPGSSSNSNVAALEDIVRRAAKAVVHCSRKDGCTDMDLRLMVLDLDTRLSEMEKSSTQ